MQVIIGNKINSQMYAYLLNLCKIRYDKNTKMLIIVPKYISKLIITKIE